MDQGLFPEELLLHDARSVGLHGRNEVRIDVECDGNARMSQSLAHHFRVDVGQKKMRRMRMP